MPVLPVGPAGAFEALGSARAGAKPAMHACRESQRRRVRPPRSRRSSRRRYPAQIRQCRVALWRIRRAQRNLAEPARLVEEQPRASAAIDKARADCELGRGRHHPKRCSAANASMVRTLPRAAEHGVGTAAPVLGLRCRTAGAACTVDIAPDLARQRDWSGRAGPTGSTGTTRPRRSKCGEMRASSIACSPIDHGRQRGRRSLPHQLNVRLLG
jgi:hypothetical protein